MKDVHQKSSRFEPKTKFSYSVQNLMVIIKAVRLRLQLRNSVRDKDWVKVFVGRVMQFLSINTIHIRWTKQ